MVEFRKRQTTGFAIALALLIAAPASAQVIAPDPGPDDKLSPFGAPLDPEAPAPDGPAPDAPSHRDLPLGMPGPEALLGEEAAPADEGIRDPAARLEALLTELAEPGRADWQRVETEITRLWARSGSAAMDLLLRRGSAEMEAGNFPAAVDHLTALTELAPDFAEGWNARASAWYMMDEYALSLADVERTLALNPRHFGALAGLGAMMEQLGHPELALEALEKAREINPNQPDIKDAAERMEREIGAADL